MGTQCNKNYNCKGRGNLIKLNINVPHVKGTDSGYGCYCCYGCFRLHRNPKFGIAMRRKQIKE